MTDDVKFVAGGTVQAGQGVYISRQADQELLALCLSGAFAYVLTPRQMGKSSLMIQTAEKLQGQDIRSVKVDLTTIGTQLDAEAWYLGLLTTICRQLGLVRQLMLWWRSHKDLGVTQRFTQFFEEIVLEEISERIVVFIDEIDTTLNLDFTDDFFIAIRSLYLSRANNPKFAQLSFVLFGVATPSDLIRNPQRTPFNIGKRVDLTDFTLSEASTLADGFGLPEAESQQVLHWVLAWTGGHPYLTQRLCQTLAEDKRTRWTEAGVADVVERIFLGSASKQDTNLQFVRDMLTLRSPDLAAGLATYRDVLKAKQPVLDEEQSLTKAHLKLSGVVKREDGTLQVRNSIYQEVFNIPWVREHLPINWAKRLRRAAIASGIIFLASTAPLGVFAEMQRQKAVQRRNELAIALADAEAARKDAVEAQESEAQQRQKAEKGEQKAEEAWQKAEAEREIAEKAKEEEAEQRLKAEEAQEAEAEQRKQAEIAREAEAKQREAAEEASLAEAAQKKIALQEKARAELATDVALLREKSTRAESRLSSPRAVEGLILAMHSVIKSRDLPEEVTKDSDILSVVESSLLRASEEAKEKMVIDFPDNRPLAVALSPDRQKIVSGMENGQIRLLDAQGNPIRVFGDLGSSIIGVAFSTDGQKIVSIDKDGVIKRWESDGSFIDSIEEHTTFDVVKASFSDDLQTVAATLTDGSVAVRRLSSNDWKEWLVNKPQIREVGARLDSSDEIIETSVQPAQRFDVYEIQGQEGQIIEASMESDDFRPQLRLESNEGEVFITNNFTEGQKAILKTVLPETGTYRLIATHTSDETALGVYNLRVEETRLIEPPILNTSEASLTADDDVVVESKIADIYEIQGSAGQHISISMESDEFDTLLRLEYEAGEFSEVNDDGITGNTNSFLDVVLPEDGVYKIIATHFRSSSTGAYTLKVNENQRIEAPILQEIGARLEEGDNLTEEIVNVRYADIYEIEGKRKQEIVIRLEYENSGGYIDLENAAGEIIDSSNFYPGGVDEFRTVLPEDGNYRVVITSSLFASPERYTTYNLTINSKPVESIAFSRDGQQIVTGLPNKTIQRWDLQGNSIGNSFVGHQGKVLSIAFSPDGQRIVSGGSDRTVRLWNLDGTPFGEPFREHSSHVLSVAFSFDGQRIISGGEDGTLRLSSTLTGNAIGSYFQGHGRDILSVAFSSDNQSLISLGGDNTVRLWEANVNIPFQGHEGIAYFVAFSPDGQSIVSSSEDGTIRLWDLEGNPIGSPFLGHEGEVIDVAFSPNGQMIASTSEDRTIRLWDLQGSQIRPAFQGHEDEVIGVAFSPDGQLIASSSEDGTIRLWDLEGNPIGSPFEGHEFGSYFVAFSPDGQLIASSSEDGTIRLWDLEGNPIGSPFEGHEDTVYDIAFSPDGQYIVSGGSDRTIRLWDLQGSQIRPAFQRHGDEVIGVAFSPDGQRIVSGSLDGTVRLWNLDGTQIGPPLQGHEGGVVGVAFSPDGQRVAHANFDGTIQLHWASWKEWIANSCNRLSHHPLLHSEEVYDEEFYQIALEVRDACNQGHWD